MPRPLIADVKLDELNWGNAEEQKSVDKSVTFTFIPLTHKQDKALFARTPVVMVSGASLRLKEAAKAAGKEKWRISLVYDQEHNPNALPVGDILKQIDLSYRNTLFAAGVIEEDQFDTMAKRRGKGGPIFQPTKKVNGRNTKVGHPRTFFNMALVNTSEYNFKTEFRTADTGTCLPWDFIKTQRIECEIFFKIRGGMTVNDDHYLCIDATEVLVHKCHPLGGADESADRRKELASNNPQYVAECSESIRLAQEAYNAGQTTPTELAANDPFNEYDESGNEVSQAKPQVAIPATEVENGFFD